MESRAPCFWTRRCRWCFALIAFCLASCTGSSPTSETLVQVNLLDSAGFSQVVTSKSGLKEIEKRDFVGSVQPYQKVSRLYKKKGSAELTGVLTSYHPNGQIYQYLETEGAYASGAYREWHPGGEKKIESYVVSGKADLDEASACTWVFDGLSRVWNSSGELEAEMTYDKGELSGLMTTYYPGSALKSLEKYEGGKRSGKILNFYREGGLYKEETYLAGLRDGPSQIFALDGGRIAIETFSNGKLESGLYFSAEGERVSSVDGGHGKATYPRLEGGLEIQTIHGGFVRFVRLEQGRGLPERSWEMLDGKRHGKELFYDENGELHTQISWLQGRVHGEQKSWYPNGQLESLRLMENNRRSGPCTAWYEDGSVMLVEEYEDDRLIDGQYFCMGEKEPVSRVRSGRGTATLFDGAGARLKRVTYEKGEPKVQ